MGPVKKTLQKDIDLEDPTPLTDEVDLGCTQREAEVNPQAAQPNTEWFKKLTTTMEADEKGQTKETIRWKRSLLGALIWKVMPQTALRDTLRIGQERRVFSSAGGNSMHYGHQIPAEDYETTGACHVGKNEDGKLGSMPRCCMCR